MSAVLDIKGRPIEEAEEMRFEHADISHIYWFLANVSLVAQVVNSEPAEAA